MGWYPYWFVCVLVLWGVSSPRDRNALRIILLATVGSFLLTEGATRQIHGAWKLIFPATVETLTILALLRWSKNRTGYMQAGLLVIAWGAHVLCYLDLVRNTDWVYDNYNQILGCVALGQIAACHDTMRCNLAVLRDAFIRWNRPDAVPVASGCARVLHPESPAGL